MLASEPGLVEERTGLHELEFIEVRRHWFDRRAAHDTEGTVNVLNLVEGDEVVVESPTGAFAPFVVHYAETFIVPARWADTPSARTVTAWAAAGDRQGLRARHHRQPRRLTDQ